MGCGVASRSAFMRLAGISNGVGTNFGVGGGEARRGPKGGERGMGFLGMGQPATPHQLGGLRERCKLPQRGPGPRPPTVFLVF